MRIVAVLAILLLLAGCPPKDGTGGTQGAGNAPDKPADSHQQLYANEAQFLAELQRLQEMGSSRASVDGLYYGGADSVFTLAAELTWPVAELVLTDTEDGTDWRLKFWEPDEGQDQGFQVITNEQTANGCRVEFRTGDLNVTFSAQWVHGRFLLCRREVLLAGVDATEELPEAGAAWTLAGPWLPYRMVPSERGPFSVLPEGAVDGSWHTTLYPDGAMAPAVAAYDRVRGMLMCVADNHPRILDRQYSMEWRAGESRGYGQLLRISFDNFDASSQGYARPAINSGETHRDTIVLMPLALPLARSREQNYELPAKYVIGELGAAVRAFHFTPMPEGRMAEGAVLVTEDWPDAGGDYDALVKLAASIGDSYLLAKQDDAATRTSGNDEGAVDSGEAPRSVLLSRESGSPVLSMFDLFAGQAGQINSDAVVASATDELNRHQEVRGIVLPSMAWHAGGLVETGAVVGDQAALSLLTMQVAAAGRSAREDALVLLSGGLNLAMPPVADCYINSVACTDQENGRYGLDQRFVNHLYLSLFGVSPILDSGTSLAEQVVSTTEGVNGHYIYRQMEEFDGFGPFVMHQEELRRSGGDLLVLHAGPSSAGYTQGDDLPHRFDELVAIVPANLEYAAAVWIAFLGTGGSVSVDHYNNLSISWGESVEYWQGVLPPGIWSIDHPNPEDVAAGDVVVVIRKPLAPPGGIAESG